MSQKLPVCDFLWVVEAFQFNEDFIKSYNKDSDEGCFSEVDAKYPEELHEFHNDLLFFSEKLKIKRVEKL